jgi:hypothetical protein
VYRNNEILKLNKIPLKLFGGEVLKNSWDWLYLGIPELAPGVVQKLRGCVQKFPDSPPGARTANIRISAIR